MPNTAVIIVAAGRGHRFGEGLPKQYLELCGMPVIRHAVEAFANHPSIDLILPVIHPDDEALIRAALEGLEVLDPVAGGKERQDSVRNGLEALAALSGPPTAVLVHDAARPIVSVDVIDRVLDGISIFGAVIPGVPVVDTLKRAGEDGIISDTVSRDLLWRAQTPQGFTFNELLDAHRVCAGKSLTDDAAVIEAEGHSVAIVEGEENNIKITTTSDLHRAKDIMRSMQEQQKAPFRIGNGYDVHKLGPGSQVTLCGIEIASPYALIGHSDADVALHAVTDAVLGAIAHGDIGSHFPPSDETWRGASSDQFLEHACALAVDQGYEIANIDLTIICEKPKIGPHRDAMRERLAAICNLDVGMVSVKATTTERLGFTGREEGIAAEASVLMTLLR